MKKTSKNFQDLPPIRVRREPPTVAEAVAAAQDLADDVEQQVEIAAGLIGLSPDEVRPHVVAAAKALAARPTFRPQEQRILAPASPNRAPPRAVIVERRSRPAVVVERRIRPLDPRR
ncbi:DNA-binding protein [Methylorubrum populi]